MDFKQRILEAAAKVYAEVGYRGATTRRIAAMAGCNELTLFRHFGSKATLIHEAVTSCGPDATPFPLPETPADPYVEMLAWGKFHFDNLRGNQSLIRTTIGEIEEHPELLPQENHATACAARELGAYLERLRAAGMARAEFATSAATTMLMGTLFGDVMGRAIFPFIHRLEPAEAIEEYVGLYIRAIGAGPAA